MDISEMIKEVENAGYIVVKMTPAMKKDSDECERLYSQGKDKNCLDCACSRCMMC